MLGAGRGLVGASPHPSLWAARGSVLLAAVCFGTTGTARALGPAASAATVGAARIAVGGALLLIVAWLTAGPARRPASWRAASVAAAGVALYQATFFAGIDRAGVAVGTTVAIGSGPILAGLGARLLDGAPLGRRWSLATALACLGVGLLASGGAAEAAVGGADAPGAWLGVGLAVAAGASYAGYTLAAKRLLERGDPPPWAMAHAFAGGALLLGPILLLGDTAWLATGQGLALVGFLGAVPTALAYLLFARGLRRLPAAETATLTLAEPVTAALLGLALLGERLTGLGTIGIGLVLAGLLLLGRAPLAEADRAPAPVGA